MKTEQEVYKTKNLFFKPFKMNMNNGKLSLGENNIFHSMVYVMSEGGDIKIGNLNIFEEKVIIYNRSKTNTMVVGNCNMFKIGAKIVTCLIEDYNEFGIDSHVEECKIGNGNIIGSNTKLKPSPQVWNQKTISTNGLFSENKLFQPEKKKTIMIYTIKKTSDVYRAMISHKRGKK
jgi:carbonic anhydrase/acetyltransferase-like protein (isoleucine patch superfamily)